jgi:hypothetical protein
MHRDFAVIAGLDPQVGFIRLAALVGADLGLARGPVQSIVLMNKGLFRWMRGSSPAMTAKIVASSLAKLRDSSLS